MKKTNTYIVYFLTRGLFLGFGFSHLFSKAGKDSYIGAILGTIIGLIFTYFYSYIIEKKENQELKDIFKKDKIWGMISRILLLLASILILVYILIIYKIFVVSFLLVSSPEIFVTIPFIILTLYCAFKGYKVISRVAGSLFPISIIFSIIILLSLMGFIETTNYLPILTETPLNTLETALMFAGFSALPNILTLHIKGDIKGYKRMYIISAITLILAALFVEGVLGEVLVEIFRFPEYMVFKQIKLFKFIEKVENVLAIIWVLDLFITAVMAMFSIKELVPENKAKLTTSAILVVLIYIIDNFLAFNYVNELRMYYVLPIISLIVPIIVGLPLLYLVKKKA